MAVSVPFTRIRDIAHRSDIPKVLDLLALLVQKYKY
jgi:hypothetical protein